MSAENQQERLLKAGWIVGFTDGEGCFSVSVFRNKTSKLGWQVFPEFVITQGKKSLSSLEEFKNFFGCGNILLNRRKDNHNEDLYRYAVRTFKDLTEIIIPFFKQHPLKTAKQNDFLLFVQILALISKKVHLSREGLRKVAELAAQMNRRVPSKFLLVESSETTR